LISLRQSPKTRPVTVSAVRSAALSARATWRWAYLLSSAVGALALLASVAGLLLDGVYGEARPIAEMLRGYDLVTLVLVVPALVLSQLQTRRGSDRALLIWVGMLAYLVYTYAYYLLGTPFNDLFLLHAAVFSSSIFALVLTVCALDPPGIAARFSPRTPRRIVGTVLALLAAALGGIWVYASVRFIATGDPPVGSALVESDAVVQLGLALDLTLLVPAYALAALLLLRRIATGYVLATVLLIAGTLHQVSYMVALLFQSTAGVPGAVAFDPFEPVIAALYLMATVALLVAAGPRHRRGAVRSAQTARRLENPRTASRCGGKTT
jgi:hypothetical protein